MALITCSVRTDQNNRASARQVLILIEHYDTGSRIVYVIIFDWTPDATGKITSSEQKNSQVAPLQDILIQQRAHANISV